MEKVKLNNQIVSMRKYVKQAKVRVINKLVKQIKLLQNRKGNEIQIQKAKRKAERFLEAVTLVKKIRPDDVSKLALLKAKDWGNVLLDKNSSVHDRCIAMLANYGAVQKEVEAFYCANNELVLKMSEYIVQWEEKNKLPKDSPKTNKISVVKKSSENILQANLKDESFAGSKKSKFKTGVKTKSVADERDTAFEVPKNGEKVNLKAENLNSNAKGTESDENSSLSDEGDNSDEESDSIENDNNKEMNNSSQNNDDNETEDSNGEENNMDQTYISKSDSPTKIDRNVKNKSKTITLLNLNELEGLDEIPVDSSFKNDECYEKESSEDDTSEALQNKNTDPFFLSHNKEDFNPKELDDSSEDSNVDKMTKDSAHSFKHKVQTVKRSFFHKNDDQISPKKYFQKSLYDHKNVSKRFKRDTGNSFHRDKFSSKDCYNKFQERNTNKNRYDFKLKNKPFPSQDTYDKKQFKNISKGYGNKDDSFLKNKVPYKKGNASELLHPSWEAKRKQKELLTTSFQGKRIVFDD